MKELDIDLLVVEISEEYLSFEEYLRLISMYNSAVFRDSFDMIDNFNFI